MDRIEIQTTQNVAIEYEIAGVGHRFVAAIVDLCIITGYYFFLAFILGLTTYSMDGGYLSSIGGFLIFFIFSLPIWLYHLICEIFLNGQSFGKKQMNIKVVRLDGSEPRLGNYLLRWLFRIIDISLTFGSLAVILMVLNKKGQRLGDIAANTTVVKVKDTNKLAATLFKTAIDQAQENHTPSFVSASTLSSKDIQLITEVLDDAAKAHNNQVVLSLAERVAKLIHVKKTELPPIKFLQTVIKDYHFLTK